MPEDRIIPEMVTPTSVCPHPELWSAYDDMATEIEVLKFLRSLVHMLKPNTIIETGCYHGHATEQLALGTIDNGFGRIYTCDLGASEVDISLRRISGLHALGLKGGTVEFCQCSGLDLIFGWNDRPIVRPIDFAFLDSGPDQIRTDELRALYPNLSPGAVVALHDSGIHGYLREKYLPPLLRELEMQFIMLDTPRGICLCRKKPEIYP